MWDGRLAAPADLDRLAERVEEAVAERVADVGVVEAAVPRRLVRERRQLLGRRVRAGRVVEPGLSPNAPSSIASREHGAHPVAIAARVGRHVVPAERARSGAASCRRGCATLSADRAVVAVEVARDVESSRSRRRGRPSRPAFELDERLEVLAPRERRVARCPSTPTTSVVTPWRTFGSWRGSARITRPPWVWRSMNPGATTLPVASIVRLACGSWVTRSEDAQPAVARPRRSRAGPGRRSRRRSDRR